MSLCALCWLLAFYCLGEVRYGAPLVVLCFVGGAVGAMYTPATNKPLLN